MTLDAKAYQVVLNEQYAVVPTAEAIRTAIIALYSSEIDMATLQRNIHLQLSSIQNAIIRLSLSPRDISQVKSDEKFLLSMKLILPSVKKLKDMLDDYYPSLSMAALIGVYRVMMADNTFTDITFTEADFIWLLQFSHHLV